MLILVRRSSRRRSGAGRGDVLAVDQDLARRRLDQAGQAADERRLARAREAHDDEQLAARRRRTRCRARPPRCRARASSARGRSAIAEPTIALAASARTPSRRRGTRGRAAPTSPPSPFRCRSRSCRLVVSGRSQVHGSPLVHAGSVLHRFRRLSASSPELGDDRGEDGVEVADDGVVGLGDHGRVLVGVDGQHPLGRHHPDPVLDGAGDAAGDVELGRDALAGLADLVGVGTPAVVGDDPGAADRAAEQAGQLLQRRRSPRPSPRPGRR